MIKFIKHKWAIRRERFYKKNRWHLVLDISLGLIIILLVAVLITLYSYRPNMSKVINSPLPDRLELDLNNLPLVFDFSVASSSFSISDGVELKINLNNNSKLAVSDIRIDLLTVGNNFSISKLGLVDTSDQNVQIETSNKQIIISSLNPGETKEIKVKVNFRSKDIADRTIKWQAKEEYTVKGQNMKGLVDLPDLYLAAELSAQAVVYYNSPQGDILGSGPLPPLVGLPTNYWVFFEVKSAGEFKNLVFSAKLPKGVELTNRRSLLAGNFTYNTSSRQVIWTVPELKNQSDSYRVGFDIQFIPNADQFDQIAVLLSNLKCYATDSLTGKTSYVGLIDLNTNLDFDQINKGEGKIGRP